LRAKKRLCRTIYGPNDNCFVYQLICLLQLIHVVIVYWCLVFRFPDLIGILLDVIIIDPVILLDFAYSTTCVE
jgi:hypothetical protein